MEELLGGFGRDELCALRLRRLYERRGFLRVSVGKFEDYALYVENRSFLQSESVITFMDPSGRLMALKPDVTLSIVKNIPKRAPDIPHKLYYIDEVYRLSKENQEYKVRCQIGVEAIGDTRGFGGMEVLDLALESLRIISPDFVLDVSHLGFVSGLIAACGLHHREEKRVMESIHAKNAHDLGQILLQAGVERELREAVLRLCGLSGDFAEVLGKARALIRNDQMQGAWEELREVGEAVARNGDRRHLNIDFSAVNDLDYYNGLIFRGYVQGIAKVVLTGGRYDNLMRKMGKQSGAIGFAVSLDELGSYLKSGPGPDFDLLLLYEPGSDYHALLRAVKGLCAQGKTVRTERLGADLQKAGFSWGQRLLFRNGELVREEDALC